jgi:uncharacterized membrane protein
MEAIHKVSGISTTRVEALADSIFAFAMTLLVLNLAIPDAHPGLSTGGLNDLLWSQAHKFFNYALSFVLLAIFWIVHHQQFHYIKRSDSRLMWINIFILMFVALMPFTNDLAGDFSGKTTAEVLFSGNMMVLGLLFLANWVYATGGSRLVDPDLDSALIRRGLRRNMVTPAVSVVVIVLSFFIPHWSLWFYLLVPAILWLKPFRR